MVADMSRMRITCVFGLVLATVVPGVRAGDLPVDLSLVGKEHIGFVQIRLADLWKGESFEPVRLLVAKAGPEMVAVFSQRFVPDPSTIDRLTLILAANAQGPMAPPEMVLVVTTTRPFDVAKLVKGLLPEGVEAKVGKWKCYEDAGRETALCVIEDRCFAIGPSAAVKKLTVVPRGQTGKLQRAVDLAAGGQPLVAALKLEALAPTIRGLPLPPPLQSLAEAQTILLSARLTKDTHIDLRLEFADAEHAEAGKQGVRFAIDLARQKLAEARTEMQNLIKGKEEGQSGAAQELPQAAAGLLGLGLIETVDEQLTKLPVESKGEALSLSIDVPSGPYGQTLTWAGFSAGLLLPAVQKVREAATRMQSQNNLKQMALAMLNYESAYAKFPSAAICDKAGKPLLSWRVAILPYIEENNLYQQFHLDEPWDSKHNIKLLPLMPKIYALPTAGKADGDKTHYRVFVGRHAMFELDKGRRIAEITDGTSNTWMIVEAAESVPWTKPEGLPYDPEKPLPKLGRFFGNGFNAAFVDGSVRFFQHTLAEATMKLLIDPSDGQVIPRLDP
jgi:prepilin-type processing-associated H-X9-DG protein